MPKKRLPTDKDNELNSAIQEMIDSGVESQDIDLFVADFVNQYGVDEVLDVKKKEEPIAVSSISASLGTPSQSLPPTTKTEQSNGTLPEKSSLRRNFEIAKQEFDKVKNQPVTEKKKAIKEIATTQLGFTPTDEQIDKELTKNPNKFDANIAGYTAKKYRDEKVANAGVDELLAERETKYQELQNNKNLLTDYQQSKEGKVAEFVSDIKEGRNISESDFNYLKQNAPTAVKDLFAGVENFNDDFPIENINTIAAINKQALEQKHRVENNQQINNTIQNLSSFVDVNKLGTPEIENDIAKLRELKNAEISTIEKQTPTEIYRNVKSESFGQIIPNQEEQVQIAEVESKYNKLTQSLANAQAFSWAKKNKDVANALNIGLEWMKIKDPTMYQIYVNGGSINKTVQANATKIGIQILQSTGDTELIDKGVKAEQVYDAEFPQESIDDVRRKIALEYAKKNGINTVTNKIKLGLTETDEIVNNQFSDKDKKIYFNLIRPDDIKSAKNLYFLSSGMANDDVIKIPQLGGARNEAFGGFAQPLYGTLQTIKGFFESKEDKANRALEGTDIADQKLIERDFIKNELNDLQAKPKLTVDEINRKNDLEEQIQLKSKTQNYIDASSNVIGNVAGFATLGYIGTPLVSTGLRGVGLGVEGLGYVNKAEQIANYAGQLKNTMNISSIANSYISSYDDHRMLIERLAPKASEEEKMAFAAGMSTITALSERIFRDEKIFDAFRREIAPEMSVLVRNLSVGKITEEAFQNSIKKVFTKVATKYVPAALIETNKEALEEAFDRGGETAVKSLGVATGKIAERDFNIDTEVEAIGQVYVEQLITGLPAGTLSGIGDVRRNNISQNALYDFSINPEKIRQFNEVINYQQAQGQMSESEAISKIKAANTLQEIGAKVIPNIETKKPLNNREKVSLTNLFFAKRKLTNDIENDPDTKTLSESQLAIVDKKINDILLGKVVVDGNFDVYTEQEYNQKLEAEKNPQNIAVIETKNQQGNKVFTVLNPDGNREIFNTQEEADARAVELGTPKIEKPSVEQQAKDVSEGKISTFSYTKESEVPEIFKDKISSKGEINGVPFVKVSVAQSLADYELQNTENNATQNTQTTSTESTATIGQNELPETKTEVAKDNVEIEVGKPISATLEGKPITIDKTETGYTYTTPKGRILEVSETEHQENIADNSLIIPKTEAVVSGSEVIEEAATTDTPTAETATKGEPEKISQPIELDPTITEAVTPTPTAAVEPLNDVSEEEKMQFGAGYKDYEFERKDIPTSKIKITEQPSLSERKSLVDDITKNGIKEPIVLEYDKDTDSYYVKNGNHRAAIAKELGIAEVPSIIATYKVKESELTQTTTPIAETPTDAESEFKVFEDVVKDSKSLDEAFAEVSKIKNVPDEVSESFRNKYDADKNLTPKKAFEKFYNEIKGNNNVNPKEGDTTTLPPQIAKGTERTMVFEEGEWKQKVGDVTTKVGAQVQKQAQESFEGKEETTTEIVPEKISESFDKLADKILGLRSDGTTLKTDITLGLKDAALTEIAALIRDIGTVADKVAEVIKAINKVLSKPEYKDVNKDEIRNEVLAAVNPISDANKKYLDQVLKDIQDGKTTLEEEIKDLQDDLPKRYADKYIKYLNDNYTPKQENKNEKTDQAKTEDEVLESVETFVNNEKSILNRVINSKNISKEVKDILEEQGLKYKTQSHDFARKIAKDIISEFGIENAISMAESGRFGGDVNSLIFAEGIDQTYKNEQSAKTSEEKLKFAEQWADYTIRYDNTAREQGRFISAIYDFYKKSPLGFIIAEKRRRDESFNEWFKNRNKDYKEVFEAIKDAPEFKEYVSEQVQAKTKDERAKSRNIRRKKIENIFDNAKIKGGQFNSSIIPPQVWNGAMEVMKQAALAGESLVDVIEKGIENIKANHKGAVDEKALRDKWNEDFRGIDTSSKAPPTTKELQDRILERFRKRLSGLNDTQKAEVIRRSFKKLVENGALEYPEFKKIVADVIGVGELNPEDVTKITQFINDINAVQDAADNVLKDRTKASIDEFEKRTKIAEKSSTSLANMVNTKPELIKRIKGIIQLNTLGVVSLIKNPFYNAFYQGLVRFPRAVLQTGIDQAIYGVSAIANKMAGTRIIKPDVNILLGQKGYFKQSAKGAGEAVKQVFTGLTNMDYFQKDVSTSQIKPFKSWSDIWKWKKGDMVLTKSQVADKLIQGTVGIPAEAVARLLNIGDKPFRYAAEAAVAETIAQQEFKLKGLDKEIFVKFPKEEALRIYKSQGLNEEQAAEKAEAIEKRIISEGEQAVFQQSNLIIEGLNAFGSGVENFAADRPIAKGALAIGKILGTLNAPFLKTPLNIGWDLINLAVPEVAFSQSFIYGLLAANAQYNGDTVKSKEYFQQSKKWLTHGAVGYMLLGVAGYLASIGAVSGGDDDDETDKERKSKKAYQPARSLNVNKLGRALTGGDTKDEDNDLMVNLSWFGTVGTVLNMQSNRIDDKKSDPTKTSEYSSDLLDRMHSSVTEGIENSIFQGTMGALEAFHKGGNSANTWMRSQLNVATNFFQPATFAQFARATLPYNYSIKADNLSQEIKNNFAARSLLFRAYNGNPPSDITIWGDESKRNNTGAKGVFYNMLGFDEYKKDIFGEPIYQDFKRTQNSSLFPPQVEGKIQVDGQRKDLNTEQTRELKRLVGEARKELVAPFVNESAYIKSKDKSINKKYYSELDDAEKVKALNILYDKGKDAGTKTFKEAYPEYQSTKK